MSSSTPNANSLSSQHRLHSWIYQQHHHFRRADSPLLGFPDLPSSTDPLFFPSPHYARDLPESDSLFSETDSSLCEPLEFLSAMSDASWDDDKPLPFPPDELPSKRSHPPLSRPQSKESLSPSCRSDPRLTRYPSFSSILSALPDNGPPSTHYLHSQPRHRDNAPTPTPGSLSPTTTAFSASSCSNSNSSPYFGGSASSPQTTAPSSPTSTRFSPFYSLCSTSACSQVYLGREHELDPATPIAFPPHEACQSRWSLTTSLDEEHDAFDACPSPQPPKSLKLTKRRRLVSFFSTKLGVGPIEEPVPCPSPSLPESVPVVLSTDDSVPERLKLDLGPCSGRLSIPEDEFGLFQVEPATHLRNRSVATYKSDLSVVPARDDTFYLPRASGDDFDILTRADSSPDALAFDGPGGPAEMTVPVVYTLSPPEDMSSLTFPESSPMSSLPFPSLARTKALSVSAARPSTSSASCRAHHASVDGSLSVVRSMQRLSMSSVRNREKKERPKSPSGRSTKSLKMSKRERIVSFVSRLRRGSFVEEPVPPFPVSLKEWEDTRGRSTKVGGKNKAKRRLIVSGVAEDDVDACEAVRRWCEGFGKVKSVSRKGNGDLEIDWSSWNVADDACRLQGHVLIKGAGSVRIVWSSEKSKLGFGF